MAKKLRDYYIQGALTKQVIHSLLNREEFERRENLPKLTDKVTDRPNLAHVQNNAFLFSQTMENSLYQLQAYIENPELAEGEDEAALVEVLSSFEEYLHMTRYNPLARSVKDVEVKSLLLEHEIWQMEMSKKCPKQRVGSWADGVRENVVKYYAYSLVVNEMLSDSLISFDEMAFEKKQEDAANKSLNLVLNTMLKKEANPKNLVARHKREMLLNLKSRVNNKEHHFRSNFLVQGLLKVRAQYLQEDQEGLQESISHFSHICSSFEKIKEGKNIRYKAFFAPDSACHEIVRDTAEQLALFLDVRKHPESESLDGDYKELLEIYAFEDTAKFFGPYADEWVEDSTDLDEEGPSLDR